MTDGAQSLDPQAFESIMPTCRRIAESIGRKLCGKPEPVAVG
jgi:hypothetical protein